MASLSELQTTYDRLAADVGVFPGGLRSASHGANSTTWYLGAIHDEIQALQDGGAEVPTSLPASRLGLSAPPRITAADRHDVPSAEDIRSFNILSAIGLASIAAREDDEHDEHAPHAPTVPGVPRVCCEAARERRRERNTAALRSALCAFLADEEAESDSIAAEYDRPARSHDEMAALDQRFDLNDERRNVAEALLDVISRG